MVKTLILLAAVTAVAFAHHEGCEYGDVINSAIVRLEGNGVTGNITFTRQENGKVRVSGRIVGMEKGLYGCHIHEKGDLSQGCLSTKAHFNPDGKEHGHPHDENRHAGDLGNFEFNEAKVAEVDFVDSQISLEGRRNIIGRALVLHEKEDDFGRTDHPDSKKTGNAGGRVACGVIGLLSTTPVKHSGAPTSSTTSTLLIAAATSIIRYLSKSCKV